MTGELPEGDCCVGDPGFGDPHGMHSYDCPVYLESSQTLLNRQIRPGPDRDPATLQWREAMSTALQQTQQALAQSQADLTRALQDHAEAVQERDEARHELAHAKFQLDIANTRLAHARQHDSQPCAWRDIAVDLMRERESDTAAATAHTAGATADKENHDG